MLNIKAFPLVSDQVSYGEVGIILQEPGKVLHNEVAGDIAEFGCYCGTTSLFISRLLQEYADEKRTFHVYDSFEGLPPKTSQDSSVAGDQFVAGELKTQKSLFKKNFRQAGLPLPVMHKGWFGDLKPSDVPDKIAFAFLDGDFYESIRDSLKLIENKGLILKSCCC